MKCFYLLVLSLAVVGCKSGSDNVRMTPPVDEWCYDGVVYLSAYGQTNTSVKFNPDSTVATETFDEVKCK